MWLFLFIVECNVSIVGRAAYPIFRMTHDDGTSSNIGKDHCKVRGR
jgi:hypothetical protein